MGAFVETKLGQCYIEAWVPQPLTGTGGANLCQPFPLISIFFGSGEVQEVRNDYLVVPSS